MMRSYEDLNQDLRSLANPKHGGNTLSCEELEAL
jgi:hypothetical protein